MNIEENAERAVSDYWDENVSNWKVANQLEVGSEDFFKEVERYRFEKLGLVKLVAGPVETKRFSYARTH